MSVERVSEEQREQLLAVRRVDTQQRHVADALRTRPPPPLACPVASNIEDKRKLWHDVWVWADPTPSAEDFRRGIMHKNREKAGTLVDVVEALASSKLHYLPKLQRAIRDAIAEAASGAEDRSFKFCKKYPNLAFDDEVVELDEAGRNWYVYNRFALLQDDEASEEDYVKAILNRHSGEARLIGDSEWELFPATVGSFLHPRFWYAQFMSDESNRTYLKKRNNDRQYRNQDLTHIEVQSILDREPDHTTAVLRWRCGISASGESSPFFFRRRDRAQKRSLRYA